MFTHENTNYNFTDYQLTEMNTSLEKMLSDAGIDEDHLDYDQYVKSYSDRIINTLY